MEKKPGSIIGGERDEGPRYYQQTEQRSSITADGVDTVTTREHSHTAPLLHYTAISLPTARSGKFLMITPQYT